MVTKRRLAEDLAQYVGARTARADVRAAGLALAFVALEEGGSTGLTAIAAGLTAHGIPSARAQGWTAAQVARLLD